MLATACGLTTSTKPPRSRERTSKGIARPTIFDCSARSSRQARCSRSDTGRLSFGIEGDERAVAVVGITIGHRIQPEALARIVLTVNAILDAGGERIVQRLEVGTNQRAAVERHAVSAELASRQQIPLNRFFEQLEIRVEGRDDI